MKRDFQLPLVGLGTCYYEFDRLKGYYETLDMTDPRYLAGVTTCVVGALGHREEAFSWFHQTAEMCCPCGIILPFVLQVAWLGSVMEDVIREVAPEQVAKIRPIAPKFFANLLRFHNHFTGESRTTELTPREFYLAQQLVDGHSYKEIAVKLAVSIGRVNDLV